jgi:hypothetical protein
VEPQLQFTLIYLGGLLAWVVMWRLTVGYGWLRRASHPVLGWGARSRHQCSAGGDW